MSGPDRALEREIVILEQKLATLLAHARALRAANDALRRELAAANSRNHSLSARVGIARERLDALLARLPATIE
jgi:cell division protein ZapB